MRVLFTTQAGSGHWRPLAPLAKALIAGGHEVAFATTPLQCADLARYGFPCFPVGVDDWRADFETKPGEVPEQPAQAGDVWVDIFVGTRARRALPDLMAVCHSWQPDVLVRESTEFAGCVAAERIGIPHVAVQVGAWRPELHRLVRPALDRLRQSVGLPPDADGSMLHRDLLLVLTPPSFADPARPFPSTARAVRYVPFDRLSADVRFSTSVSEMAGRPTVYATLGTAYNRTPGLLQMILVGLRDEPIAAIVTLGPGLIADDFGEQPRHIRLEHYLPQSLIFPYCDLVVCHGGFSTMMTALGFGVPLVMIPIAADQADNARRCHELGVALAISPEERTVGTIQAAIRAMLGNTSFRFAATRLRDEIRAMPGLEDAVRMLERLADSTGHGASRRTPM
jgi:UDP:flavonoid glycosyltransferase YjiC (YdhE family)